MNRGVKILSVLLVVFSINFNVFSQQDNTLFFMHELPQANFVNPAVAATCKLFVGFPALSSVAANYSNTALSLQDALVKKGDSLYWNPDNVVSNLHGKELITSDVNLTLFTMGLHFKRYYFTFSVNERATVYNMIQSEMIELAWEGNTRFAGDQANVSGTRVNAGNFHEFAFGASTDINDRFRLGVRTKFLFGLGNVYTPKTTGYIFTDENSYALNLLLSSEIRSSLPLDVEVDEDGKVTDVDIRDDASFSNYFMNFHNFGIALDAGFIFKTDDKTTISGSLLDFGGIFWNTELNRFISDGVISYAGTTKDTEFDDPDYFQILVDSLVDIVTPVLDSSGYMGPLVPKVYVGATREISGHLNAGVLVRTEIYRNRLHPSLTLSANTFNYKTLNASISYTIQNGEFTNIGAGIGLKAGPVHFHIISDNIPGFFRLDNTRNLNIRFGLSFVPGCDEKFKTKSSSKSKDIRAIPCYYSPYKSDRKKPRKR
ncbi:MAG: hypothetical protein GXO47_04905 [Chlorobi bacterium]|nr:hypothetical protein [Chlorobiota bacterium]